MARTPATKDARWFSWAQVQRSASRLGLWSSDSTTIGSGFESTRYLGKWLLISGVIGVVAGLGAIVFSYAIDWSTAIFLGQMAGYIPPSPIGEGSPDILAPTRPWMIPLVVALGGLISGIIVFRFAPEAEGHGTDAAIAAIHFRGGAVRARIPPVKLIASAITIGSGGSGGREGPTAQISAGFASLLSDWLRLDRQDRRIAVAAGMGAGIGAIFRAPLGGALMGAEILYLHDLEVEAIIPSLIASIIGYTIYGAVFGFTPIFGAQPDIALGSPVQLVYYGVLGVLCGVGGILYSKVFYAITARFHDLKLPRWLKPAIGGLLVGGLGLIVPGSLHMGYGWVQVSMGQELLGLPLWMVLALPLAKILATSLSIGSGGSGGIFGPGMVIGGMLGASLWRLMPGFFPGVPESPAPFVIVGMMALFGGIAHAPLAVMLMVAEMTGNLSMLAPAMVAVGVSTALVGDHTIYRSQLPTRAASPAHRIRFSFPLLSSLFVHDAMRPIGPTIRMGQPLSTALPLLKAGNGELLVLDEEGSYAGILDEPGTVDGPSEEQLRAPVAEFMTHHPTLRPGQPLDDALADLVESGRPWIAVVEDGVLRGRLSARDVIVAYKDGLERSVRRSQTLPESTVLLDAVVEAGATIAGRELRDAGLPSGVLVLALNRDGETIFPTATTRLTPGDLLTLLADRPMEAQVRRYLQSAAAPGG